MSKSDTIIKLALSGLIFAIIAHDQRHMPFNRLLFPNHMDIERRENLDLISKSKSKP